MTKTLTPDICVIGAGSGGLSVAAAASAFGENVVLIEKNLMGGECLNYGCVPSKALLASAKSVQHQFDPVLAMDLDVSGDANFQKAHQHLTQVIAAIAPHDSVERFESLGVTVLKEKAEFISKDEVTAGDYRIKARRFVVATGSAPAVPPIPGLGDVDYLTNETVFDLTELPSALTIIGAGAVGLELGQAFHRLGSKVTIIDAAEAFAKDDREFAGVVLQALRAEGIEIIEHANVSGIASTASGPTVRIETQSGNREVVSSHLMVAAGRLANTEGLGFGVAGVKTNKHGVEVDGAFRTSNPRVYAIGDVIGGRQFTHAAGYQAGLVIRNLLFRLPVRYDETRVPWTTFTEPELGHAGLTLAEAREKHGDNVRVLSALFAKNDRAIAEGRGHGGLKLYVGPRGILLGADVVGPQAGEAINFLSTACSQKMKMKDLAGLVLVYPTYGEAIRTAALSYFEAVPKNLWVRRLISVLKWLG
ncbi:MAG: FAD-dependent oxidoreductase [Rhodobacteraceae bacterium]|nr:FAD-dependent oxidoreductase [Paracoccaceae bacterium]